jgi:hypothetical protein
MLNNTDDLIVVTVKNQTYSDTSGDLRLGKAPESRLFSKEVVEFRHCNTEDYR